MNKDKIKNSIISNLEKISYSEIEDTSVTLDELLIDNLDLTWLVVKLEDDLDISMDTVDLTSQAGSSTTVEELISIVTKCINDE